MLLSWDMGKVGDKFHGMVGFNYRYNYVQVFLKKILLQCKNMYVHNNCILSN